MAPEDEGIRRILVVTAHPDDVDFGAAGSVAVWTAAGIDVAYCIVTDGDAGGAHSGIPRDDIVGVRRKEQTNAAAVVGVSEIHWLGFPDGMVEANLALRREIARVIRLVRPDRVVCQSPERNLARIYASHPDHLAAGEAAICAVYPDSRNAWSFPELLDDGFEPHTVPEVYVMGAGPAIPDRFVDTTGTIDRKIAALLCHESQIRDTAALPTMIKDWGRMTAAAAGWDDGRTAEGFVRIDTA